MVMKTKLTTKFANAFFLLTSILDLLPEVDFVVDCKESCNVLCNLLNYVNDPTDKEIIDTWTQDSSITNFFVLGLPEEEASIISGANYIYLNVKTNVSENDIGRRLLFLSSTIFMFMKQMYKVRSYSPALLEHAFNIISQLENQMEEMEKTLISRTSI